MGLELGELHVNELVRSDYTHIAIESKKLLRHMYKEDGVGVLYEQTLPTVMPISMSREKSMISKTKMMMMVMGTEEGELREMGMLRLEERVRPRHLKKRLIRWEMWMRMRMRR